MNTWNIVWSLLFMIAIVIPPQKAMGAKGFMSDWDSYIEKPAIRLSPPKFIQVRYKIGNTPINLITYITFLVDFVDWVMCIFMLPCTLLFQGKSFDVSLLIYVFLYIAINLPIGIMRTICTLKISKKQKIDINTEKYVMARSLAEMVMQNRSSAHREATRKYKEYIRIVEPFLRDFEKCLDKQKGVQYISDDNLRWAIDRIIPKYEKHLTYNVSSEDFKKRLLTIRLISNNEIIIQVPVKKLN